MLTGLKVSGFKNLMDVDIRFSPFTCVAGANGVGKSNLFDGALLPVLNWLLRRLGVKVAI
jgi:AAA15 family ATPase/GTPase